MAEEDIREKKIVHTSVVAIGVNLGLAGLKAVIGAAANSIAITLDAVNNLSDALSSVITILGTKLGAKKPDKKHPMGYGRVEYFSELIVSTLVLYAGISSVVESIKKIRRESEDMDEDYRRLGGVNIFLFLIGALAVQYLPAIIAVFI